MKPADRKLLGLQVYVVGGGHAYVRMMFNAGFFGAKNVEDADIVLFTGGEDVTPEYYGEKQIRETHCNPDRDKRESIIYADAVMKGIPMIGICRGGQFLNVMNGGKMWQHVNNHGIAGVHSIITSDGELKDGMTSTHHQMMRPSDSGKVLATCSRATLRKSAETSEESTDPFGGDVEVVWYEDSKSLCFQPHPEYGEGPCQDYFLELVDEYILTNS